MNEFVGTALNIVFVETGNGNLRATAEIILIYSEPTYSFDASGEMIRQRRVDGFRFGANAKALREIATIFGKYADDMDADQARWNADLPKDGA